MKLTPDNYFSDEANREYMSSSQFKAFKKCEAAALAEIEGRYHTEPTTALLVGSYVDAAVEGTLNVFRAKHPELFKKDGDLKADYVRAEQMLSRLEGDELFMAALDGDKQVILTGEIAGVPFKGKLDVLLNESAVKEITRQFPENAELFEMADGAIVDLKTAKSMDDEWNDGAYRSFGEIWGYQYQGAIYRALEGHELPFILACVTKETSTNIEMGYIPAAELDAALMEIEELAPHYQDIKDGKAEPERCEHCEYCRATKRLTKIVDWREMGK